MDAASPDMPLRAEAVDSEAAFMRLQPGWNSLVGRTDGHVFMRHEWFSAAWAWRRTDSRLHIVCVYGGSRLVGVLPLMRSLHAGSCRVLEFLCAPDTQWCDALVDPAAAPAVGRLFAEHLVAQAARWDVLCLERLAAHSQVQRWLAPVLAERRLTLRLASVGSNRFVDLTRPWTVYQGSLSRSLKKTRNLAANRLALAGKSSVQWITASTLAPGRLERCIDEVVSISSQSWKRTTGNSLDRPAPQAFLRALTQTACAERWLSLWLLRLDDKAIAMEYQLVSDGRVYALRADFDSHYKDLSPGSYLNYCMLERLFASGLQRYYMGPGNNFYKTRWSALGDPVYTATGYSPSLRGRAHAMWAETKLRLRAIGNRSNPGLVANKRTPG